MRKALKAAVVAFVLASISKGYAEVGLGDIWGVAFKIGDIIVGETTVTPAYAIYSWQGAMRLTHPTLGRVYWENKKVKMSLVTRQYFFNYQMGNRFAVTNSTAPFPVDSVNRINMTCTFEWPNKGTVENNICDHKIIAWLAKVETTGLWPQDGPWEVFVRTKGNPLIKPSNSKTNCSEYPGSARNYWSKFSLSKSGHQIGTIGSPDCALDYPYFMSKNFYD